MAENEQHVGKLCAVLVVYHFFQRQQCVVQVNFAVGVDVGEAHFADFFHGDCRFVTCCEQSALAQNLDTVAVCAGGNGVGEAVAARKAADKLVVAVNAEYAGVVGVFKVRLNAQTAFDADGGKADAGCQ